MAISCRNFGQFDPWKKRVVFLDGGAQEVKSENYSEKIDAKSKEIQEKLNEENAKVMQKVLDIINAQGPEFVDQRLKDLNIYVDAYDQLETDFKNNVITEQQYTDYTKVLYGLTAVLSQENDLFLLPKNEPSRILKELSELRAQASQHLDLRESLAPVTDTDKKAKLEALEPTITKTVDFNGDKKKENATTLAKYLEENGFKNVNELIVKHAKEHTLKNGTKVAAGEQQAKRGSDGKFYDENKKYVPIYEGDIITINKREAAEAKSVAASQSTEETVAAEAVREKSAAEETAEKNDLFMHSEIKESEFWDYIDMAKAFNVNKKIAVPASIRNMDSDQFAKELPYMNHGKQVKEALFALDPNRSTNEVYKDIRSRKFDPDEISMDEISLAIKGKHSHEIFNEMPSEDEMAYLIILERMQALEKTAENGELLEKALRTWAKTEGMEDRVSYVLNNREQIEAKLQSFKDLKDFVAASAKLAKEIPQLGPKTQSEELVEERAKIEGIEDVEQVAGLIFNKDDHGPEAVRNFFDILFGERDGAIDMQTTYKKGDKSIQLAASGESAYVQLVASALEYGANGEAVVNKEKFAAKINDLKFTGYNNVYQSGDKELIKKCEAAGNEEITREFNMEDQNLSSLEADLIRYGLQKSLDIKRIKESYEYKEMLEGLDPIRKEIMAKVIERAPKLTPEEFKEAANVIEKQLFLLAGLKFSSKENRKGQVKSELTSLSLGGEFDLAKGLKGAMNFDTSGNLKFELIAGGYDKNGVGIHNTLGARAGENGTGIGIGTELTIPLDKYQEHNAYIGYSGGVNISEPAIGLAAYLGYRLNLDGTYERIMDKEYGAAELKSKLDHEISAAIYSEGASVPDELKNALRDRAFEFAKMNMGNQSVDKMPDVAITDVGVSLGLKGFGIAFRFAIKDKVYTMYSIPPQPDVDEFANLQIKKDLEAKISDLGTEVFVAGQMTITPDGFITITEAEKKLNQLEALNAELAKQGLHLEPVEVEGAHRLRLKVSKSNGNVDIYTDKNSGIETIVENGVVYLNIGAQDQISLRRVNTLSGLRDHNGVLNTEIFISNNLHNSNQYIKHNSADFAHFEAGITEGQTTKAVLVEAKDGASATFKGIGGAEGIKEEEVKDLYADMQALEAAGDKMSEALRSAKYERGLSPEKRSELEAIAKQMLEKKSDRLEYKKLSTEMKAAEITAMVKEANPDKEFSPAEMTYMHQALMIASLAKAPKNDEALIKHIEKWNQQALERQLLKQFKDLKIEGAAENADSISKKIMAYYAEQIRSGQLSSSAIEAGSIVQIQVGTERIEGYRQAFYQPNGQELSGAVGILQRQALNEASLMGMGLSAQEAALFQQAVTERLSPIETPEQLFKSQLGLSVLSAAELVFTAEHCTILANMLTNISKPKAEQKDVDYEDRNAYKEFSALVKELREKGEADKNGVHLSVKTTKEIGLYDACKNFTMVMNEQLSITMPVAEGTDVQKYVQGKKNIHYTEFGLSTFIRFKKAPPPEPPEKPKEPFNPDFWTEDTPVPEAEKTPKAGVLTNKPADGSIRGLNAEGEASGTHD